MYAYVGPNEILQRVDESRPGQVLDSMATLRSFVAASEDGRTSGVLTLTYVVDVAGRLRVADRHSEHVQCAGGEPVLTAGELTVDLEDCSVIEVTNQSTGYCPESTSFPALGRALDALGVDHPRRFTRAFEFRRCTTCGERSLVKDNSYICELCGGELPDRWNFA